MTHDAALLRRFVAERSDVAFRELVLQQFDFVYAAALRQVGGDACLAQEVAQSVFLDLARKAPRLVQRSNLAGWLFTSTRFAAAKARRSRARRLDHESEAYAMQEVLANPAVVEVDWREMRAVIDAAMGELGDIDREVILLRFFRGHSLAEVGAGTGLAENSARMRVERALEKLRKILARHGVVSTTAALGAALAGQPAVTAPAGLAGAAAGAALAGAATAGGAGAAIWVFMSTTKSVVTAAGALALFGVGAFVGVQMNAPRRPDAFSQGGNRVEAVTMATLGDENHRLQREIAQLRAERATEAARNAAARAGESERPSLAPRSWQLLAELYKQKLADPRIAFLDGSGKLNEAFMRLFELNPAERETLQRGVESACARLERLERENATVTRDASGNVVITVKPFAEAGGAVYDELIKNFAETLGPERQAAFAALGAEQVEKVLGRFGATQRTITITSNPASTHSRYLALDENILPGDHSRNSSNYRSREDLLNRVGTITKLLPPDF